MKLHKKVASWVIDYGYMIRGASGSILYQKTPDHYLSYTVAHKVPVIIIPGVLGKWSFLKKLADKISLAGHPVYIVPDLGYNLFTIPDSARKLQSLIFKKSNAHQKAQQKKLLKGSAAIEKIIANSDVKNIMLVAHSKGGLIGKYFLAHFNTEHKVTGLISIATPYSGSAMAKLLPLEPISELDTDSKIIRDLATHTQVNKQIISIIPEYDNHVWTKNGSYLEGADNIEIKVHGHHKVVFSEEVHKIVLESLEKMTVKDSD